MDQTFQTSTKWLLENGVYVAIGLAGLWIACKLVVWLGNAAGVLKNGFGILAHGLLSVSSLRLGIATGAAFLAFGLSDGLISWKSGRPSYPGAGTLANAIKESGATSKESVIAIADASQKNYECEIARYESQSEFDRPHGIFPMAVSFCFAAFGAALVIGNIAEGIKRHG